MREKVLYINLPDGAYYRRVEVTENGRIGIVYTEQDAVSIPKPIPLIDGTEVYQKDNGTPYWYCKIKAGRDEFMHLYFEDLTEKYLLYDENGRKRQFVTERQKKFKDNALKALKNKPTEGYRWIPVFEPSIDSKGNLRYVAGAEVLRKLTPYDWEDGFKEYSSKNGSQLAPITTYFLLALRWLKDGVASLEELADDSKEIGHYWNSENTKHDFERTGEREFGGIYGFVGNTYKTVKDSESSSGFSFVGGCYRDTGGTSGFGSPLANVKHNLSPRFPDSLGVALLELTK